MVPDMSIATEKVFIDALSLPSRERAALVHKLLQSLEPEAGSEDIQAAWRAEVLDRCKAFDTGELMERDADLVLREAYKRVR
jgi:putative addiction module component (TIGR02574 family)